MAELLSLTLDSLPPSANRIWRAVKGQVIKSAEYRGWLDATAWKFAAQAKGHKLTGPYALSIAAGRPDKRRRDIDNLLKPLSDAIVAAGLVTDDSLCQRIQIEWADCEGVKIWLVSTTEHGGVQSWA